MSTVKINMKQICELIEYINAIICANERCLAISPDTILFGIHNAVLDSLDTLNIIVAIKEKYGVDLVENHVIGYDGVLTDVSSLAHYIEQQKNSKI